MKERHFMKFFCSLMGVLALVGCTSHEYEIWGCSDSVTIKYEDMEASEITEELSTAISRYELLAGTWTGTLSCTSAGDDQEPREVTIEIVSEPISGLEVILGPGPEVKDVSSYDCDALAMSENQMTILGSGDDVYDGRPMEIVSGKLYGPDEEHAYIGSIGQTIEHELTDKINVITWMEQDGTISIDLYYNFETEISVDGGIVEESGTDMQCTIAIE